MSRATSVLLRLLRSGLAGLLATLSDLAVLTALTELGGLSPRAASVPALLTGAVVMFFGQKHLAFGVHGKPKTRQVVEFAAVQLGGLVLTGFLYDSALRLVLSLGAHYVLVRLVTTNLVWLGYSFPLWHVVFRDRSARAERP